ncbi:MAG: Ohr family peroxiredoxin [Chloroflexota bacterium]|nr:Ohr family peroxiredoxin [Dehalococcoidia bacterium]MDW8252489.1 Ohr family peroxiredoxin [Chloroflexota bacterium]
MTQEKKILYTARVKVTGGRGGVGRTEDGKFEVQLKPPVEFGGQGDGANPEQLFGIGYAACFESTLRALARRAQLDPKGTAIDTRVHIVPREDGPGNTLAVEMDVAMPNVADPAAGADLIRQAHQTCPYSNATRGNIDIRFTINGHPVDLTA